MRPDWQRRDARTGRRSVQNLNPVQAGIFCIHAVICTFYRIAFRTQ